MSRAISKLPIKKSWKKHLEKELSSDYISRIENFLSEEISMGKEIYPEKRDIFSALNYTDFENVKVVIMGQDPYHGPGQAHGLSFSVPKGIKVPPSLKNIYKELHDDVGAPIADHGFLESWAKQGVLLLNSVLTVEAGKAGSHQKIGWQKFTDFIISKVNDELDGVVFILWGSYAQKKAKDICKEKHLILESAHPSPLSSYRGFFGSKPFSKANAFLVSKNKKAVDWSLPTAMKSLFE